ncbi:serine/threonine protein kinase [Magnetofaba australis]|uniref:Putative serine/threonine protein kinase, bacterial n=1 Tax=Magnetofaba australis IT-1 TaxID=1434232 RepID=A0A1Y2JZQ4_9PROT|nr:serine/threonine-protein kinase [Magnetofaba australis]OSM00336.1 putative serine/threonine protein kinase, bacterial [Magnetofaba australis IT-1]
MSESDKQSPQVTQRFDDAAQPSAAKSVTERFDPPQHASVTERFDAAEPAKIDPAALAEVTERFDAAEPTLEALQLKIGDLVDDKYQVEAGPLGVGSGEAEIYRCRNALTGETVILKFYRFHISPKRAVLEQLLGLTHPGVVSLQAFGAWGGRFFEVMEYCRGGELKALAPVDETRLLEQWLPNLVEGLRYCHTQNIVHRDIKPGNLFFRDAERTEAVIADFGISSILEEEADGAHKTRAFHFTLDYAAPEMLSRNEVGPPTDFYALGISLLHLVLGASPFDGMHPLQISVAHVEGRVPISETGLSERFRTLLSGLLQVDPGNRWGYAQLRQWLGGEAVLDNQGRPWKPDLLAGKSHPYPGYPQATNLKELAASLDAFDAARHLFRGDVRRWIFDHFSPELAAEVEEIQENDTEQPELGVWRLKLMLDPTTPLPVGKRALHSLGELIDLLRQEQQTDAIVTLFNSGKLAAWVAASQLTGHNAALAARLRDLHRRIADGGPRMQQVALRFLLDETFTALTLGRHRIEQPADLGRALHKDPAFEPLLSECVRDGVLAAWLAVAQFPNWEADAAFLEALIAQAPPDKQLAYGAAWRFYPELPFPFIKQPISEPKALAAWIDQDAQTTEQGRGWLQEGWIRAWLAATGKMDLAALDEILDNPDFSAAVKLEILLGALDPDLPPPQLRCSVQELKFGRVHGEQRKILRVTLRNVARGYLFGSVLLDDPNRVVSVNHKTVEGEGEIAVAVEPRHLPMDAEYSAKLRFNLNGGVVVIPISYRVVPPWRNMLIRSLKGGFVVGAAMGLLRGALWLAEVTLLPNSDHDMLLHASLTGFLKAVGYNQSIFANTPLNWASLGLAVVLSFFIAQAMQRAQKKRDEAAFSDEA